jgi:hypothetical protein
MATQKTIKAHNLKPTKDAKMKNLKTYLLSIAAFVMLAACANPAPSTAISNYRAYNLVNSTRTVVADLASRNSDNLDHQIKIASAGRVLACAQVHIDNPAGIALRGACHMLISDGTGPTNGLTEIGRAAVWHTTPDAAYDLTVPVVGYATKAAGTYNVVVECEQLAAIGHTAGMLDNMVVWEGAK